MRASSAMKLLSACCGSLLLSMPSATDAKKMIYDKRTGDDSESDNNCVDAVENKTRYLQIEVFDYNLTPWIKATWTQISDECGGTNFAPYSATMEYNGNTEGDVTDDRIQMDMYICAPWGNYELEVVVKSTNGGDDMEKVAWEVEYGPDEYHIWDTLNTPFFDNANGADPSDHPYAPIPNDADDGTTYTWPLPGSEGYYSVMYSGPFPPLECANLHPAGVEYVGCYDAGQDGWTTASGPSGSANSADPAEPYRMFDGLGGRGGVNEDGVMTLQKCADICSEYAYFGLESAIKCVCGNGIEGSSTNNCGLADSNEIDEYKYLCSGDSRVLCGTDDFVSIYSLDGSVGPPPSPTTPAPVPTTNPSGEYVELGCSQDKNPDRIMPVGPIAEGTMSAEVCFGICMQLDEDVTYFGTQYSNECFCATALADTATFDFSGCNMGCANTAGETCGGNNAITVYQVDGTTPPDPTPAPVPTPTPAGGYESLGCSADKNPDRIMPVGPIAEGTMSAEICFAICADEDAGYNYFGTQYSNECFCATALADTVTFDFSGCNMDCANTADGEICGGNNAISVYEIDGATPPSPTPAPVDAPTPAPVPTPTPSGDYEELGCSADKNPDRIMPVGPIAEGTMSAEICFAICADEDAGYNYFGTQYSNECFCAMTLADTVTFDFSGCNMDCANTDGETCGGNNAITVYQIDGATPPSPTPAPVDAPTPAPVPTPTPSGDYEELGCSADKNPDRIMPVGPIAEGTMSAEICFGICMDEGAGYDYFGTQYSNECFCAMALADTVTFEFSGCNMNCANNNDETCGGNNAITVYKVDGATPPSPTPAPVPSPPAESYEPLGCFADNQDGIRIMDDKTSSTGMTAAVCFGLCSEDATNTHFGTQYGQECWCVNDPEVERINQFSDVDLPCNMECTGDVSETCGGNNSMTVYKMD